MEKWSFQRTRELMTPRALRGMAVNEVGRARISMMVRSMSSNSRPDTLVQDRTPQPHRFLLQRTAGPYIGVNPMLVSIDLPSFDRRDASSIAKMGDDQAVRQTRSQLAHDRFARQAVKPVALDTRPIAVPWGIGKHACDLRQCRA